MTTKLGFAPPDRKKKKKKKHSTKGWWFPPEIVQAFYNGAIDPRELIVLGVIDSLTRTFPSVTIGCYASNKVLATKCQVTPMRVSQVISKLESKGLLIRYINEKTHRRYLAPKWRMTGPTMKISRQ
jgi:hypothetical protein